MKKTYQKMSTVLPKDKNKNLGLMIVCGNCSAMRVFKIDDTLRVLQNRATAGQIFETECEECGHSIAVIIGWIDASKFGYSHRGMEFSTSDNVAIVSDDGGLTKINQKEGG